MTKEQRNIPLLVPVPELRNELELLVNKSLRQVDLLEVRKLIHRMIYQRRPHRKKHPGKVGRPTVDISAMALNYAIAQHKKGRLSFRQAAEVLKVNKSTAKDAIENPEKYIKRESKSEGDKQA